jgi:hypothetical protein
MPEEELDEGQVGTLSMIRCKHVADALAESNFMNMSLPRRLAIRVHVSLCIVCNRFHKQLIAFHKGEHRFRTLEDDGQILKQASLTSRRKEEMKRVLDAAKD